MARRSPGLQLTTEFGIGDVTVSSMRMPVSVSVVSVSVLAVSMTEVVPVPVWASEVVEDKHSDSDSSTACSRKSNCMLEYMSDRTNV